MDSDTRQSKRRQVATEGGAYHTFIPFSRDDYSDVHARKGRLIRVGPHTANPVPDRSVQKSNERWSWITTWAPMDDPDFALDPDGEWYDEEVEAPVMQEKRPPAIDLGQTRKKGRSKVSKRPNVVWKDLYRQTYLDEILRSSGRGDFCGVKQCPDCVARKANVPGSPEYRCRECFLPDLTCQVCCARHHRVHPLHRIEKWSGSQFVDVSLKSIGLWVQLNHSGLFCKNPIPCHASMLVIHTNGIHEVAIDYCGCARAIAQHLQLLCRRLYPASQLIVKTCASFELLDLLHKLALTTKASTYDFYHALEH